MNFSLIFCGFLSMVVVGVLLLWICRGGFFFDFFFLCVCVVVMVVYLIFCVVAVLVVNFSLIFCVVVFVEGGNFDVPKENMR